MLKKIEGGVPVGTRPLILSTGGASRQPLRSSRAHPSRLRLKMQLPSAPGLDRFQTVETALQAERLSRYMPAARGDRQRAFQYYLWNLALCETFVSPLHFAEIVCRNALNNALLARAGDRWFDDQTFRNILDMRFRRELDEAVAKEQQQHGARMTAHHVVSALTFGFWEHLTTKRFERYLWARGIQSVFPCAPAGKTYEDVHTLIESVRRWRNRIAHHRAIFDKGPMRKHQEALDLIRWACADTSIWVASTSRVPVALALRPRV